MDTAFITIVQNLVSEQGKEALFNAAKCKSFLADYTRGEYKKETRLLAQAVEAGVSEAITNTRELEICKKQQVRHLQDEYFLTETIAAEVVDMLALVLRTNTADVSGQDETTGQLFCSECDAKLNEGAKFCSSCGKPVTEKQGVPQSVSKSEQKVAALTSSGGVGYGIDLINSALPEQKSETLSSSGGLGYGVRLIEFEFPENVEEKIDPVKTQEDIFNIAIQKLTDTITQDPDNANAYIARGEYYICKNDIKNARSDFINVKRLLHKRSLEYVYVKNLLKLTKTAQGIILLIGFVCTGVFSSIIPPIAIFFFVSTMLYEIIWLTNVDKNNKKLSEIIEKLIKEKTKS
jgi:hypothetical protein